MINMIWVTGCQSRQHHGVAHSGERVLVLASLPHKLSLVLLHEITLSLVYYREKWAANTVSVLIVGKLCGFMLWRRPFCNFIGTTCDLIITNTTKARNQSSLTSSRCACICVTCLARNCVDWNQILCEYRAGQHSERDKKDKKKNIHPQIYSDPSQCQHLKSTCSHLFTRRRQACRCQLSECAMYSS